MKVMKWKGNHLDNISAYPKGSEWHKWDLHVHTPLSLTNPYGGDSDEVWEKFISDLEGLAPEFSVLGINDYLFLDGYKRLLAEKKENNRLKNIDLLVPVVEFRIKKFSGIEFKSTKRINLHVIFSEQCDTDHIEGQFLNGLSQGIKLEPGNDGLTWNGLINPSSLADLGKALKGTVPEAKLPDYGSDLEVGFNILNFDEEQIFARLQDSSYFPGKYLIAIGKTEWDEMKWTDSSIGEKKDIINRADIVFVAAESVEKFHLAKKKLQDNKVNNLLLDCSDAHEFSSNKKTKDRIGNCFTWIKAIPTFDGLRQIINEPEQRVFIGDLPPLLKRIKQQPTRFASSLTVRKATDANTPDIWFDQTIPLNPGLVAVIGRKGSGKSALADIVALLGNTPRFEEFSFLSKKRFREPKLGLAEQYEAELTWESNYKSGPLPLSHNPKPSDIKGVDYIPQSFLERICNEISAGQGNRFYRELQDVIFSHIPKVERFACENLSDLIQLKTEEGEGAIGLLLENLRKTNKKIVELERRLDPENRERLTQKYLSLLDDIRALRREARPKRVNKPNEDAETEQAIKKIAGNLHKLKGRLKRYERHQRRISKIYESHSLRSTNLKKLRKRIKNLVDQHQATMAGIKEIAEKVGVDANQLVQFRVNTKPIEDEEKLSTDIFDRAQRALDPEEEKSLARKITNLNETIEVEKVKLTEPQRKFELFLEAQSDWRKSVRDLIDNPTDGKSARGLKSALSELDKAPNQLSTLQMERNSLVESIFREKEKLKLAFQELHQPIQKFINEFSGKAIENELTFSVTIQNTGFVNQFLGRIHQGRIGSFSGKKEGQLLAQKIVDQADCETFEGVKAFLKEIEVCIKHDTRMAETTPANIDDQLRDGLTREDLYDFLYGLGYLAPEFEIGWAGKKLDHLSPGEKGNLLLIFYLLVDQSDRPLVIDQPEENLDNETIFRTLVPCVREARKRRQVLLVTHNPNLAVVCDADQVIHASINKSEGNRIIYTTGAIEDKKMNELLVDVLEGTRPAFDSREAKYEVSRS